MLPQELFNEIVDLLSDDRPSLIALSRTAQCLRARSQAFLFHKLVLSPHHSPTSYIPLLEMSPHILTYVRRLRIITSNVLRSGNARVHEYRSLERLIDAAINVDDIEMLFMSREGLHKVFTAPDSLLPIIASPRVRMLTLTSIFLPSPQSLFIFFSYFPSVSSLRLEDVYAMGTSPSIDPGNILLTEISLSTSILSSALGECLLKNAASGWLRHLRSLIIASLSDHHHHRLHVDKILTTLHPSTSYRSS